MGWRSWKPFFFWFLKNVYTNRRKRFASEQKDRIFPNANFDVNEMKMEFDFTTHKNVRLPLKISRLKWSLIPQSDLFNEFIKLKSNLIWVTPKKHTQISSFSTCNHLLECENYDFYGRGKKEILSLRLHKNLRGKFKSISHIKTNSYLVTLPKLYTLSLTFICDVLDWFFSIEEQLWNLSVINWISIDARIFLCTCIYSRICTCLYYFSDNVCFNKWN